MNKSHKIIFITLILSILALGYFLRSFRYAEVPFPGDSLDEYSYTWVGLSLIKLGVPVGISGLESYQHIHSYINVDGYYNRSYVPNPLPVDTPWFDHPFLFTLIPGGYVYSKGVDSFADTSVILIRKPMIWIGTVNILLVFILGYLVFGKLVAYISAIIYATEPLIVISSRTVHAENFLITMFLLSIISYFLYIKQKKSGYYWLAISLAGISTLVKESGISIILSILILNFIFDEKKLLNGLKIIIFSLIFPLVFPLYGFIYDGKLFIQIVTLNSERYFREGLNFFNDLLIRGAVTRVFNSGWITLGWISTILLGDLNDKKKWWILIPLVSYLTVYALFGSEPYGWYKYPFYPFLVISIAFAIIRLFQNTNTVFTIMLVFMPGAIMLSRYYPPDVLQAYLNYFRIIFLILVAMALMPVILKNTKYATLAYKGFIFLILIGLIVMNIITVRAVGPDEWYKLDWLSGYI